MPLEAGTKLDHYEVIALIGAGGMGEVYRACDARLRRDVAVKLLPIQLQSDPERLRRFEKEARTTGALNHPGLLSVFDFGVHGGSPYLVTELLDGATLRETLRGGRLPLRKAIDYASQIALALASAHDAGVVHRDIKPANLFVTTDGRLKILDFGIAKALEQPAEPGASTMTAEHSTADGSILGTAGYMAPEQVRGVAVDHRADIFALGVVLYEMLSGTAPFSKPRPIDRALATLNDDPPSLASARPDISPALELVVRRCMEKEAAQRFESARDVAYALQALLSESGAVPRVRGPSRWRWRWRAVVVASTALAASAALFFLVGRATVRRPAAASASAPPAFRLEGLTHRAGRITRARFAPDEKTIIFSARFDGDTWKTYSTEPGNPEFRILVDQESYLLDVSRTGDIALLLRDRGRLRLARVPLAGGTPRVLLDSVNDAAWAPDGSLIAGIGGEDAHRIEYPLGKTILENKAAPGKPWRVGNLSVSPDGRHVAYSKYTIEGGPDTLEIIDRQGARRTAVPQGFFYGVAWRPDGREVWYGSPHGVFAAAIDAHQRQVVELPGEVWVQATAPDGRALISIGQRRTRLLRHSRDQDAVVDLAWHDRGFPVALSYDGKLLLIMEVLLVDRPVPETYVRSTDGKPAVYLGPGYPLALSPDGAWALVAPDSPATVVNLIPTDAGQNRALALGPITEVNGAVFFPDGKHVAIGGHASGKPNRIWIVDVSGAAPPRPIGPEGVALLSVVSPDGTKVLGRVVGADQAIMISVDGGSSQPLPELVHHPQAWSADGNSLYVWVLEISDPEMPLPGGYLAAFDLRTRKTTRMPGFPDVDPRTNDELWFVAVTPDASSYVYGLVHISSTLYLATGLQ